jgi:NADH-quinone oxidoreductase subunit L
MFVAAGVGVYSVAMFHLFTHAFFKAMLFLGAGSVIHATHHEQDMRNYGGLRKKIPLTFAAMMIGTLAITGVGIPLTHFGFAGFLSKDAVIESAYVGSSYAFWLLVVAAAFTSFYSWRLMFMTFYGESRAHGHGHDAHGHDDHGHGHHEPHESPAVMLIPLGVLALGAVFSGMVWYNSFFGDEAKMRAWFGMPAAVEHAAEGDEASAQTHSETTAEATATEEAAPEDHAVVTGAAPQGAIFLGPENHVIHAAHEAPKWVKVSPFIAMILGFALAFQMYIRRPDLPAKLAAQQRPLYLFLLNKWYFDELYDWIFVRPAKALGRFLWKRGDGDVIDGSINGIAMGIIPFFTRLASRAQSGYLFHYAFAMVLGIAALLTWMTLSGGAH